MSVNIYALFDYKDIIGDPIHAAVQSMLGFHEAVQSSLISTPIISLYF